MNSCFAKLRLSHQLPISHSYHPSCLGRHLDVVGDWYNGLSLTVELTQKRDNGFYEHPLTHFVQETIRSATKPYSIGKPSKAVSNRGRWLLPSAFMTYSSHLSPSSSPFRSVKKAM